MKNKCFFSVVCIIAILVTACGPTQTPGQAPVQPGGQATEPPTIQPSPTQPSAIAPKPEPTRVEFQASDGRALVGYYYPSPSPNAPVVVLMHMMGFTQKDWATLGLVDWLQNWPSSGGGMFAPALLTSIYPPMPQGLSFAVFTFDFRGFGESLPEMPNTSMTGDEFNQWVAGWLLDAQAAYEKAKTLPGVDPTRIAGIGASIGADGVVDACGEGCLGALSLSPGDYLNVPYKAAVKAVDDAGKPVWCIAHEKDVPSAQTCKGASGQHYNPIIYAEGGGEYGLHGMVFLDPDKAPADIGQHILDFLFIAFKITP
jgi:dienelactone hydrolase